MKLSYKQLSMLCITAWILFLGFVILDSTGSFADTFLYGLDLGITNSLKFSAFTRAMFFDIGILSTLFACWIAFGTKEKFRYFFAFAALFIGSLAVLPFLALYFWRKEEK